MFLDILISLDILVVKKIGCVSNNVGLVVVLNRKSFSFFLFYVIFNVGDFYEEEDY